MTNTLFQRFKVTLSTFSFVFASGMSVQSALAQSCTEYFTSVWGTPLDMNSDEDVLTAFPNFERSEVNDYSVSGGIFSFRTTGSDPWFKVLIKSIPGAALDETSRYGNARPIDTSVYQQMRIRMNVNTASVLQVFWDKPSGSFGSTGLVNTTPGWQTYTVNLDLSNWRDDGAVHGIRIDPTTASGEQIQIDSIEIVPAGCDSPELRVATFRQPDREGGEDFFAAVKNNPANFYSPNDVAAASGHSSTQIYPSNSYRDNAGLLRQNDYFEGVNNAGNGDSSIHLAYPGKGVRIDANKYKIACWTFDTILPASKNFSVVRLFWNVDGNNTTTDDLIAKLSGESRYCFRLDSIPVEPALQSGRPHPWKNNADGTGIDTFRFDPHEEEDPTRYRLTDMRVAADHVADKRFTVVVQGERASTVDISYRFNQGSPVGLATLSANRNSDTFIWNTESLPSGVYTLQSKVGLTTFSAPGPVVVEHSDAALDTTPPILQVDVPNNGHTFDGSLQLAGYALDNRKVAAVEAHLDGALIDSFSPSNFDTRARDAYPTFPSASDSGFSRFVDTSGLASGAHTVTITTYDTAGNTSTHTATVTKAAGANPAGFVVPFTEGAPVTVPDGVNNDGSGGDNPDGAPTKRPRLSVRLNQSTLTFTLSANGACPTLRLLGGISKAALASSPTIIATSSTSKLNGSSAGLYKLKAQRNPPKLFIGGDCGAGSSIVTSSIDPTRIAARRSVKNVSAVLARVLARYRNGR